VINQLGWLLQSEKEVKYILKGLSKKIHNVKHTIKVKVTAQDICALLVLYILLSLA